MTCTAPEAKGNSFNHRMLIHVYMQYTPSFIRNAVFSRFSCIHFFATWWTTASQAPLTVGISQQECWSGFPCPPPGDPFNPGIEPLSPMSPALAGEFFTAEPLRKPFVRNRLDKRWHLQLQMHHIFLLFLMGSTQNKIYPNYLSIRQKPITYYIQVCPYVKS